MDLQQQPWIAYDQHQLRLVTEEIVLPGGDVT
jgi:hypothetical protein